MAEDADTFKGTLLTGNLDQYNAGHDKLMDGLLCAIEKRYKDVQQDLLKSTKIASLKTWPVNLEPGVLNNIYIKLVVLFVPEQIKQNTNLVS